MNTFRKEPMQQLIIHLLHSLEVVLFVIGTTFVTKTFLFDISFPHSRCSLLSITTTHCWKVTTRGSWKPANNSCMETWMKTWFENFCHLGNYIELLLLWFFHVGALISDMGKMVVIPKKTWFPEKFLYHVSCSECHPKLYRMYLQ